MKKIIKSFTFWFAIVGIIGIILNLVGFDDISLFIGLNPILNALSSSKACCDIINSIPYLWYILSMITMIVFGHANVLASTAFVLPKAHLFVASPLKPRIERR